MPLPRGTDQVSILIAWCLEAHARWQPGLNMHDDAVEKEWKKEHYLFLFFFKKVLNDLPALLLTLHWDAAVRFKGASWTSTWVKLWFKRESGREICSSSLIKQPRSFPDSGFAYDNCCCNQTFHSLQLCGPPSVFIRIELFVSTAHSPLLPPPLLLLLVNCMNMGSSLKPCSLLYVCAPDRDPHPWRCRWQPRSVFLTYRAAGSAPV